jgi:hypothetical protein
VRADLLIINRDHQPERLQLVALRKPGFDPADDGQWHKVAQAQQYHRCRQPAGHGCEPGKVAIGGDYNALLASRAGIDDFICRGSEAYVSRMDRIVT